MEYLYSAIGFTVAAVMFILILIFVLRFLKKNIHFDRKVIIILCILGFAINFYGIVYGIEYKGLELLFFCYYALMRSIYNVACLFVFRDTYSSMSSEIADNPYFIAVYYTIDAVIFIIYGLLVLMMISWRFASYFKIWFASSRKLYIFTTLNEESYALAKSINEDNKKNKKKAFILFITKRLNKNELSDDLYQNIIKIGCLVFEYDGSPINKIQIDNLRVNYNSFIDVSQKTFLDRVGVPSRHIKKGVKIFSLSEDPRENISFVLHEHHPFNIQNYNNVQFYLRLPLDDNLHMFNNNYYFKKDSNGELIKIEDKFGYHNLKIICQYPLVADQFLNENKLYKMIPIETIKNGKTSFKFNMCLLGAGDTGDAIFKKSFTQLQAVGLDFYCDIFDSKIDEMKSVFEFKYRNLSNNANIKFYSCDVYRDLFTHELFDTFGKYHLIVVSIGNDEKCVEFANNLIKGLYDLDGEGAIKHPVKVAVHISNEKNELFLKQSHGNVQVVAFGNLGDIYNSDIIINEKLTKKAQLINYCYSKLYENEELINKSKSLDVNKNELFNYIRKIRQELENDEPLIEAWEKTSVLDKESSISSAQHLEFKKYLSSLKDNETSYYDAIIKNEELLENLAIAEHLRWNAFNFSHDWGKMEYVEGGPRKDNLRKKHICLVDWDELETLSNRSGINYKSLDYLYLILMDDEI